MVLDIRADGVWTVEVRPVQAADSATFSGKGDAVSGLFDPPATGPWEIRHGGQRNFIVYLHCSGGSDLIQNEIGSMSGSRVVRFPKGPCLWEVTADGAWSLASREMAGEVEVTRTTDVTRQEATTTTPTSALKATANGTINLRSGPGTVYSVIGTTKPGEAFTITAKIADGTWLEICCASQIPAWVSASVVTINGDVARVNVVKNIPPTPQATVAPQLQIPAGWVKYADPGGKFDTWNPPNWSLSPLTGQNAGHTSVDIGRYHLAFFQLQDSPIAQVGVTSGSIPIDQSLGGGTMECTNIELPKGNRHVAGTFCRSGYLKDPPYSDTLARFVLILALLEPK